MSSSNSKIYIFENPGEISGNMNQFGATIKCRSRVSNSTMQIWFYITYHIKEGIKRGSSLISVSCNWTI